MNNSDEQPFEDNYVAPAWYRHEVFKDPEFRKELMESILGESKPANYFMEKYLISDTEIRNLVPVDEGRPNGNGIFEIYDEGLAVIMRFSKNITRREYDKGWDLLQWYKKNRLNLEKNKSKRKDPEHTELLYAIHKARHQTTPLTYKQIFKLYENGNLPRYSKKTKPFKDEESLERYYQKYKPRDPAT